MDAYKRAKNQATFITCEARKNYERNVARSIKDNPKEFWSYVKKETGIRNNIATIKKEDGSLATASEEKAQLLKDFFVSVFTKENTETIPNLQPAQENTLREMTFTREELESTAA